MHKPTKNLGPNKCDAMMHTREMKHALPSQWSFMFQDAY
jgi:hypothetical protein